MAVSDERRARGRKHRGRRPSPPAAASRPADHPQAPPKVTPPSATPEPAPEPVPSASGRRGLFGLGRRRSAEVPDSLKQARRQVADLQRRHDKQEAALAALRRDLATAGAERDQLRGRTQQLDSDLAHAREGQAMAELQLREARDKWGEAERQGTALQQALAVEQDARQRWEAAATDLQHRLAALVADHDHLRQEHSALGSAHAAEQQARQSFETLSAERAQHLERLGAEHVALRQAHDAVTAAHQSEAQAHAYFEQLAAEKSAALDALQQQHDSVVAAHRAEAQAHATFQALAEEKAVAFDALSAEHASLRETHAALAGAHAEEQRGRELAEIQAAAHADRIETLSGEIAALREELASTQASLAQVTDRHAAEQHSRRQWEAHAGELSSTLAAEREQYQRTLEDERRTAEAARAEQAFQHREQLEQLTAQHTAAIGAVQEELAQTRASLEATTADLGATRADVVRLTEELQASRGEAEAANLRAREEGELRLAADRRREEVEADLAYVRSEVLGGAETGKKRGLLRRGKAPAPMKSLETQTRPVAQAPAETAASSGEEVDEIIERRLFGDG